jgi:MFS family permease
LSSDEVTAQQPLVLPRGAAERAAVQRRTLRVLMMGQVIGAAALASAITVGGFVVEDMVGVGTPWVGISTAAVTAGAGMMSQVLSRIMRRYGRRPGMQLGYGLAVIGGLVACLGAQLSILPVFLAGLLFYGAGSSTNLLARYAATDLAEPDERSRAMSRILFASTFGAVFGPALIGPAESAGQSLFGLHQYAGPWLFSSFFFLCAMINISVRLRPDPLVVWAAENNAAENSTAQAARPLRLIDSARVIARAPMARVALLAMIISQSVMVGIMAMAPIDMKSYGHEHVSSYIVSAHIAGMFAFSPLVGAFADRHGSLAALRAGGVVLLVANVLSALAATNVALMFVAMWALGLGWTLGLVGGSSLLITSVPATYRVAVQGTADLTMSVCGGLAGLGYGFVMDGVGYPMLSVMSGVATLLFFCWVLAVPAADQPARG